MILTVTDNEACAHHVIVSKSVSMEAILACHPARSTKWQDWVANSCYVNYSDDINGVMWTRTMTYSHKPHESGIRMGKLGHQSMAVEAEQPRKTARRVLLIYWISFPKNCLWAWKVMLECHNTQHEAIILVVADLAFMLDHPWQSILQGDTVACSNPAVCGFSFFS